MRVLCCSDVNVPSVIDTSTASSTSLKNIQFRNILMMLRKCTNHPYLIEYPLTSDGNFRLDEQLIESSGKMMMLDVMLRELKARGHKVRNKYVQPCEFDVI